MKHLQLLKKGTEDFSVFSLSILYFMSSAHLKPLLRQRKKTYIFYFLEVSKVVDKY